MLNGRTSKLLRFEVSLDNPIGIYQPGDLLQGRVSVKAAEDIPVHGIHLWVLGQSDVSWADKPAGKRSHFEYEIYMKDCLILWGKDPREQCNDGGMVLTAGGHDYPFQYPLPTDLPSSFESEDSQFKGRVHFLLRAKLDSPEESIRQHRDRVFLVLASLDLNKQPRVAEAIQVRKERAMYCCCCKSGAVACILRLDRTGFVPGEDINMDAEIQNHSRREVTTSYVTLQQVIKFYAQGLCRYSTSDIFRISGGTIRTGDSAFYHDIIHIPPLPPSKLEHCRLINIHYVLTVGVLPSGMVHPVEVALPIIIGTVPFSHIIPPGISVSPSFSRYSHASGEIEDYSAEDYQKGRFQHVYTYYKALYKRTDEHQQQQLQNQV